MNHSDKLATNRLDKYVLYKIFEIGSQTIALRVPQQKNLLAVIVIL